ncbi:MAG: DUF362 domain-containing protein [Candidatus Helarchaeota archaeon]
MTVKLWKKVASNVVRGGAIPFPITDTIIEFLQTIMTEEQARFLLIFKRASLNLEQIKSKVDMSESDILKMLDSLMKNGIISGTKSRSKGIMVYTLMPPFPGLIEFSLMKGEMGEKQKKLARIFEKLVGELRDGTQKVYDEVMEQMKNFPPFSRVVPVEECVQPGQEIVLLAEDVSKLIDHYETIGVAHCYCKQERTLNGEPCKVTDSREHCLLFGKAAEFATEQGFARKISQEEAKKIMKENEDLGLVHKVFHAQLNMKKDIDGICSCCKCCCGLFRLYYTGVAPFHTMTSYMARINADECVGCGTCVEKCPMETITIEDNLAVIGQEKCIGCGVCAHLCPQGAITIDRTGPREVFLLPPKINAA